MIKEECHSIQVCTHCQNVSGSSSRRHSAPNPNLKDETDHLARAEMSGQGRCGGGSVALDDRVFRIYRISILRDRYLNG